MNEIMNDFPDAKTLYIQGIINSKYVNVNLNLIVLIQELILKASEDGKFYTYYESKTKLPRELFIYLTKVKGYKVYEFKKTEELEFGITQSWYEYKISWEI